MWGYWEPYSFHRAVEYILLSAHEAGVERLRLALADAIESVEEWAGYASDYFREKHDLAGTLKGLRAALAAAE